MTGKNDLLSVSRRALLKGGALLSLGPSLYLAALPEELGQSQTMTSGRSLDKVQPGAPAWMKDLIIYEIATKGFTSPNGPESGTFNSLRAKLAYLEDLGINGIWLTGYSLCDPSHFYNIWTQYAVIEPDKFDPTLGTAEEFKAVIDEAHRRGIKVFLDVITHGLMKDSPVIRQHPSWFRGGSWGMTDFDWTGGHTDLDDWWVRIYTDYVTTYGVDGYRLDVDIYRPDLWERIRQNAAAAGHPIVIWEEVNAVIPGVTDFTQRDNLLSTKVGDVLGNDLPGFYDRKFGRTGYYEVQIQYRDLSILKGSTKGDGQLGVRLADLSADTVGRRFGETSPAPDGLPDVKITLDRVARKPIANIVVTNDIGDEWQLWPARRIGMLVSVDAPDTFGPLIVGPEVEIHVATLGWGSSILLSCHDNGWDGFPLDKNPYVAQGSRSLFGYSFMFSPMIPIFFSGEEFDATFHPLPKLSPHLYGDKDAGKGRWMYGAMLDWNELQEPEHRDMLIDVKKMMAIRREHSEVLAMWRGGKEPNLKSIPHIGDIKVPVPYVRWDEHTAIVIAGNRNRDRDANLRLRIALAGTGLDGHTSYLVTDLWSTTEAKRYTTAGLDDFLCTVKRDGTAGGGLSVFKIESV
jgi:Alpha amylase, catalytic domain